MEQRCPECYGWLALVWGYRVQYWLCDFCKSEYEAVVIVGKQTKERKP